MDDVCGEVSGLIATLRGRCLRLLTEALCQQYEGLAVAARSAKRRKVVSRRTCRKLERIDDAYAVSRHISGLRIRNYLELLSREVRGGSPAATEGDELFSGCGSGHASEARTESRSEVEQETEHWRDSAGTAVEEPEAESRAAEEGEWHGGLYLRTQKDLKQVGVAVLGDFGDEEAGRSRLGTALESKATALADRVAVLEARCLYYKAKIQGLEEEEHTGEELSEDQLKVVVNSLQSVRLMAKQVVLKLGSLYTGSGGGREEVLFPRHDARRFSKGLGLQHREACSGGRVEGHIPREKWRPRGR